MGLDLNQIKKESSNSDSNSSNRRSFNLDINKINNKRNTEFFQELSILLSSGLDIKSSLEIIISSASKEKEKELYSSIWKSLLEGDSLNVALKKTKAFSLFDYHNVKIGEETGNLIGTLELLQKYHSGRLETRQKIQNALTYPVIVIIISLVAVFVMLKYIVPVFTDVYARFDQELPAMTQKIIYLSDNLGKYFGILIIFISIIGFLTIYSNKSIKTKSIIHNLVVRIPYVGKMVLKIHLVKLFHSLFILVKAKVGLVKSLELLQEMVSFVPITEALKEVLKDLMYGANFAESLSKHKKIFDPKSVAIIKVGEEVNQLEFVIEKVKNDIDNKLQNTYDNISNLLEPFLIIFVGLLVGVILVSMYLPMFQMSGAIF